MNNLIGLKTQVSRNSINLDKVTAINSNVSSVMTASQMINSSIFTGTPGSEINLTTATATEIYDALSTPEIGSWFEFIVISLAAFGIKLTTGTGVTIVGNAVANNSSATFVCRIDSDTAVTIYRK